MKKIALVCLLLTSMCLQSFSQERDSLVPFKTVFHKLGNNVLHSITYNYGLNTGIAFAGTYVLVNSGFDWYWNRLAYNNNALAYSGIPSVAAGGLIPFILPAGLYFYGRNKYDYKLQITGLALGQAALLGFGISSSIKAFTGRRPPGILGDELTSHDPDYSKDFKFGFWNRGAFNGWPSGHTMTAFAMSVCLMKLYPESMAIRYGALTYATLIGVGISVNIHWFSDFFAGALIGYAIGATVGESFKELLDGKATKSNKLSFYANLNSAGVCYNF